MTSIQTDGGVDETQDTFDNSETDDGNVDSAPRKDSLWIEYKTPFHPFVDEEPKSVVILTYQRSGSSFFGQMFNSNPNAFYMFEPLDSLYSALYGTSPGWNVPSDITTYSNGTERLLPKTEIQAVSTFLGNLFTCNIEALPTETVAHRYWTKFGSDHFGTNDYVRCLRSRNLTLVPCHENTVPFCGKRFGEEPPSRLDECNRLLWSSKYRSSYPEPSTRRRFNDYRLCESKLRETVEKYCISMLDSDCSRRSLRAVKTVRATMDSMEPLLRSLPNFRVIHLIRDPRAVALSRSEFDNSAVGFYSIKSAKMGQPKMLTEAKLYCRWVARDVRTRRRLMAEFPGRIYPVIYDDIVRDLTGYTKKIHRFLDTPIHAKTFKWITGNARRKRNGTTIASRWQTTLTVLQNEQILNVCSELFQLLRTPDSS